MKQNIPVFSVSEISNFIKMALEQAFPVVKIVGEISNFSKHQASGHLYFSLKDGEGLIKAICFKQSAEKIEFKMEDGMKVVLLGKLSAYPKSSNYQIIVQEVEKTGVGELAKLFEELKQKLSKEGLFKEEFKKPLPFLPKSIGLITAEGGAVLHDILKTLEARFPVKVLLYKSTMQGVKAAQNVISGIKCFNQNKNVEVIIIARGGGSCEDLFEFNNEALVREAFNSKIPIISAIGHETDFTLLDFVADRRAATPTASVILAVPSLIELLVNLEKTFQFTMQNALNFFKDKEKTLYFKGLQILQAKNNFQKHGIKLENRFFEAKSTALTKILKLEKGLEEVFNKICFYDVEEVLKKGFALVSLPSGEKVTSVKNLNSGQNLELIMQDGILDVIVAKNILL